MKFAHGYMRGLYAMRLHRFYVTKNETRRVRRNRSGSLGNRMGRRLERASPPTRRSRKEAGRHSLTDSREPIAAENRPLKRYKPMRSSAYPQSPSLPAPSLTGRSLFLSLSQLPTSGARNHNPCNPPAAPKGFFLAAARRKLADAA